MKARKKPVDIDYVQWKGFNQEEVEAFVGKKLESKLESETAYVAGMAPPIFSLAIETKEGVMKAMSGDYIIKEPFPTGDRDFYPCKESIFLLTYDKIEETADWDDTDLSGLDTPLTTWDDNK